MISPFVQFPAPRPERSPDDPPGFTQTYGAGFRQIMQLDAQVPLHWYVNSTGQSANVLSRHYDDMIEAYLAGTYYSLPEREHAVMRTLELTPVPGQARSAAASQH